MFFSSALRVTCLSHLIVLDLITVVISEKKGKQFHNKLMEAYRGEGVYLLLILDLDTRRG
jgi:hypothetical protein